LKFKKTHEYFALKCQTNQKLNQIALHQLLTQNKLTYNISKINQMKQLTLFLIAIILFAGCKKDDDDSPASYFRYEGKNYDLTKGFLVGYGETSSNNYEFDIFMYSGMQIYNPDSVVGSGPIIGFNVISGSNQLVSGEYHYSDDYDIPQTFSIGLFLTKWDQSAEEWQDWIYLENGTISITNSNGTLTIIFDCATPDGKSLTGKYHGKPDFFDGTKK